MEKVEEMASKDQPKKEEDHWIRIGRARLRLVGALGTASSGGPYTRHDTTRLHGLPLTVNSRSTYVSLEKGSV